MTEIINKEDPGKAPIFSHPVVPPVSSMALGDHYEQATPILMVILYALI